MIKVLQLVGKNLNDLVEEINIPQEQIISIQHETKPQQNITDDFVDPTFYSELKYLMTVYYWE